MIWTRSGASFYRLSGCAPVVSFRDPRQLPGSDSQRSRSNTRTRSRCLITYWNAWPYSTPTLRKVWEETVADESKLPLLVSISPVMGEVAAWADYVLPDTTYLEKFAVPGIPWRVNKGTSFQRPVVGSFDGRGYRQYRRRRCGERHPGERHKRLYSRFARHQGGPGHPYRSGQGPRPSRRGVMRSAGR